MKTISASLRFFIIIFFVALLSACGNSIGDPFGWFEDEEVLLPGERISILSNSQDIEIDSNVTALAFDLPPAQENIAWITPGGPENHAPGHLALATDIEKIWSADIGEGGDDEKALLSQVIGAIDTLYTMDNDYVVRAFDLDTGKRKWQQKLPVPSRDQDVYGGGISFLRGQIFASTGYGALYAIRSEDGNILWQAELSSPTRSAPAASPIAIVSVNLDNNIQAFDPATGQKLWSQTNLAETTNVIGASHPAISGDQVVVGLSSGEVNALSLQNGRKIWSDVLLSNRRSNSLATVADITAMPIIDGGLVIVVGHAGVLAGIELRSGSRLWEQPISAGETPALVGDYFYLISNKGTLYGLTKRGARARWITSLTDFVKEHSEISINARAKWHGPLLAGGRLFALSEEGHLLSVSPQNGDFIKLEKFSGTYRHSPIIIKNTMILLNQEGVITAIR